MALTSLPRPGPPAAQPRQGLLGCGAMLRPELPLSQGLMAIPVSIFFSLPHQKLFDHYIRFCFMKVKVWPGGGKTSASLPTSPKGAGRRVRPICVGAG